jgi:SAM-dependent methyltransferase
MPDGWEWDETLFQGSAAFYTRGRPPYPESLRIKFAEALHTDGAGRLLDVGCGPGTVALQLAPLFDEVVGVDADRDMVAEAARLAQDAVIGSSRFVCLRAEDLPSDLGWFRVATFAASFHWMDRERVAGLVFRMLEPTGAFVQVDVASPTSGRSPDAVVAPPPQGSVEDAGLPHPLPPDGEIAELVRSYLGPHRRAGQGVLLYGTPGNESEVVEAAGFGPPETVFVGGGQVLTRSVDDIVANVFSASHSAPHLFGDGVEQFELDLRALLTRHSESGLFAGRVPFTQLRIWRKPC